MDSTQAHATLTQMRLHQQCPILGERARTIRIQQRPHLLAAFKARVICKRNTQPSRHLFSRSGELTSFRLGLAHRLDCLVQHFVLVLHRFPRSISVSRFFSFDRTWCSVTATTACDVCISAATSRLSSSST